MKEPYYRAKNVKTGDWEYGSYLTCLLKKDVKDPDAAMHHFICSTLESLRWEVDPNTLCQSTGKVDSNNRDIFEGDILCPYGNVIVEKDGMFSLRNVTFSIIGNVFDNPEFLKEN